MFRRLFTLVVLSGVFVGGYYLGRRPDSPDLVGWLRGAYHRVASTAGSLSDMVDSAEAGEPPAETAEPPPKDPPPDGLQHQTTYTINGKTYVISRLPSQG